MYTTSIIPALPSKATSADPGIGCLLFEMGWSVVIGALLDLTHTIGVYKIFGLGLVLRGVMIRGV